MLRASSFVARSAVRSGLAMSLRTYTPGKVITPEHVNNREKIPYNRASYLGQWFNCCVLLFQHFFPSYFGCFVLVYWARGGFNGDIPPPLD
ncbi:hypothetical protein DIPPA_10407 [Diplonema papillatum]|nr:hypothetical protein DIPPA_10407 [Diplonema papillatum]